MAYKWKPSAAQRAAYSAAMREAETYTFINSPHPIRTGDSVTFFDVGTSGLVSGVIERHSYGAERGQHTFSVRTTSGALRLIKGRNLYPQLTAHIHITGEPS
jgi:hypothetical protein